MLCVMLTFPSSSTDLLSFAEQVANGLEMHGPWVVGMEMASSEFKRILGEAGQAEVAWSAAEKAKAYSQARMATADKDLTAWLAKARLMVKLARGEKWSEQWTETGFTHRAGSLPKRIETRIGLARRLVNFLSLHPEYGVPFAGVTAARGRAICERMMHARDALELARTASALKKRLRNAAKCVLQRAVEQVVRTVDSTIAPNDPRRLAFGLSQSITRPARERHLRHQHFGEALTEPKPIPLLTETLSTPGRTAAA
jgi:hypothetical protein